MKRILLSLAFVLLAAGCNDKSRAPVGLRADNLTLSTRAVTLNVGQTFQLSIVHTHNGNTYTGNAVWNTSNSAVATVDAKGLVTAVAAGTATISGANASGVQDDGSATITVTVANPPPVINLGTASTYGILAGSAVTCVTGGTINADVGVSPGSAITGFPPCTITGTRHAADAVAATAQNDLTTAYNALVAFACGTTVTPADLGGRTLAPGVYCASTSLAVTGTVTLDGQGNANAFWVFQMGSTLTTSTTANIALINGAQPKNVYWQVGSSATLGTGTTFRGTIVTLTSIALNDNATMLGRALARNGAVTLGTNNSITLP